VGPRGLSRGAVLAFGLLLALALAASACADGGLVDRPEPPDGNGRMPGSPAYVTRVVDGDTIIVGLSGQSVRIRLIGIDTPETVAPDRPVQCYGPEASRFTTSRLQGREVRLEFDVERLDRYGRTLAYVWADGELFNEVLVREGFATVTTYPPNVRYVDRFVAAQRAAREAGRGFWGACADGT
jgi:micrococcal nuclease